MGTDPAEFVITNSLPEKFQALLSDLTKLENMDAVKYNAFLVFDFKADAATLAALFNALVLMHCDIVGVSHHGQTQCSAVCRRTKNRVSFRFPAALGIVVDNLWCFKLVGKHVIAAADFTYEFLQAWGQTGGAMRVNFQLLTVEIWTKDIVLAAWTQLSPDGIMMDILTCEEMVIMKRKF